MTSETSNLLRNYYVSETIPALKRQLLC